MICLSSHLVVWRIHAANASTAALTDDRRSIAQITQATYAFAYQTGDKLFGDRVGQHLLRDAWLLLRYWRWLCARAERLYQLVLRGLFFHSLFLLFSRSVCHVALTGLNGC
jgi:hypothetical protein